MKKLFTVLALCASVLVASAETKPAVKKAAVKKETCKKGMECCKHKTATTKKG